MVTPVTQGVRKRREALRVSGFRPVQIWVPDSRRPGFAAEYRRQSARVRGDAPERETTAWVEAVADTSGWV